MAIVSVILMILDKIPASKGFQDTFHTASKGFRARQIRTILSVLHWRRRVRRCPHQCKVIFEKEGTTTALEEVTLLKVKN